MALFDENDPQSEEAAALLKTRLLLCQCPALVELLEAADMDEAKALIVIGPHEAPSTGETYTIGQLENRIAYCQLFPTLDDNGYLATRSKAVAAISEKAGLFHLQIRRQVRAAEFNADDGRRDVYLYFLDRTSRMAEEFIELADLNLASEQIQRRAGPLFNPLTDRESQGLFIFADFLIRWGGSENAE